MSTETSVLIRGDGKSVKFTTTLTLDQVVELIEKQGTIGPITEYPSRDTDPKIIELRKSFPKAYMAWTPEEDTELLAHKADPMDKLIAMFQRTDSAIKSRIKHLKQ